MPAAAVGLSGTVSEAAHETRTCLTFEIIPSLWKQKADFIPTKSVLPDRLMPQELRKTNVKLQGDGNTVEKQCSRFNQS